MNFVQSKPSLKRRIPARSGRNGSPASRTRRAHILISWAGVAPAAESAELATTSGVVFAGGLTLGDSDGS
jgi:hypothetical protein